MRTLHLISHTHWDREWYLPFQEFRLKLVVLIDHLLEMLERDRDFRHFMLDGQTIILDDYLQMRPDKEAILQEHVRRGRILIGPWHILPDEFLVSPEATIRNLLQGERTASRFGRKMQVGYIPDPFGHIGQMPQILRGFGIETAVFRRGLDDQPCELWWQAPDGSRVFTVYLRDSYDNAAGLPTSEPDLFASEVMRLRDALLPHTLSDQILLMHGTDHMLPPADTARAIRSTQGRLDGDRLVHSTLPEFISALSASLGEAKLPVVHGELRSPKRHHLLPGVLSARIWIKQRNHDCQILLEKWAEPFSTAAAFFVRASEENETERFSSPRLSDLAPVLREAWRLLMENHPHDSICGCSVDQVHDEMKVRFDQVEQIGELVTRQSLDTLAGAIDTRYPNRIESELENSSPAIAAIAVFNPLSFERADLVTAEFELPAQLGRFEIIDEQGEVVPHQPLKTGSRDLLDVVIERSDLAGLVHGLHDGQIANLTVQELRFNRKEELVIVDAVLSEDSPPNRQVWQQGMEAIGQYLDQPDISRFHIRARSTGKLQVSFPAREVPGLGWRTYWLRPSGQPGAADTVIPPALRSLLPAASRLMKGSTGSRLASKRREPEVRLPVRIQNEFFVVELKDGKFGSLTVIDLQTGDRYSGQNIFIDGGDCGDEYNYSPPENDTLVAALLKNIQIRQGPATSTLVIELEMDLPLELAPDRKSRSADRQTMKIVSEVSLTMGVPRVDFRTTVENSANDHRLRVHFSAPFFVASAEYDGHFEVVRRPVELPEHDETWVEEPRPEQPQRAFTAVSNGNIGLMLANRGLPEMQVLQTGSSCELALTLLRCVGWLSRDDFTTRKGHAGPFLPTPGAQMPGSWTFEYALIPHVENWSNAWKQAYAFNTPLRAASTTLHMGNWSPMDTFLYVEPDTFVISAVKPAEDNTGWIVRGYNLTGSEIDVRINPRLPARKAEIVNLAEEQISRLELDQETGCSFSVRGHEIVTIKFSA